MATFYDSRELFNAALPAAGAFSTSTAIAINGYTEFTPLIEYTRGGAGGAVTIKVQISNENFASSVFYQIGESQAAIIVPGTDVVTSVQRTNIIYTATGATLETVTFPTFTCVGQFMRILAAESGNLGAPGTLRVVMSMRGDQT